MATAKIWVFDNRQPEFLIRRKDTYYIQTWHGTPLKKLALDMEDVFMVGETDINEYKKETFCQKCPDLGLPYIPECVFQRDLCQGLLISTKDAGDRLSEK